MSFDFSFFPFSTIYKCFFLRSRTGLRCFFCRTKASHQCRCAFRKDGILALSLPSRLQQVNNENNSSSGSTGNGNDDDDDVKKKGKMKGRFKFKKGQERSM